LISKALPSWVAATVDNRCLKNGTSFATRSAHLYRSIGWLLVVDGVSDAHTTLNVNVENKYFPVFLEILLRASRSFISCSVFTCKQLTSFGNLHKLAHEYNIIKLVL
jgi:hypothetical protein